MELGLPGCASATLPALRWRPPNRPRGPVLATLKLCFTMASSHSTQRSWSSLGPNCCPQPPTAGFHPLHPPAAGLPNCPATRLGVNSARWGRRGRPVRTPASVFPAGELRPLATLWRRPAASCSLSPNVASTPLTSPGACPAAGQGSDRVWAPSGAFSHGYCSGWRCNAFPAMLQHHIATSRRWEPQGPRQLAAPIWRRCWGPMGRQGRAIVMGRGTQQLPEPAGEPRKRACLLGSSGTRGCKGGAACDAPLGI